MRFSCLTIAIACITGQILLTSASAYELDNNEGIDIRGPGGVYRPSVVSTSHVNKKKVVNKNQGTKSQGTKNSKPKSTEQILTLQNCEKAPYPPEVIIPARTIKTFDLTENFGTYTVTNKDNLANVIQNLNPNDDDNIQESQIIAAVIRANPNSYTDNGFKAGAVLRIPSVDRISLEDPKTGDAIFKKAGANSLRSYKLPELIIPWAEEDKIINNAQLAKQNRDYQVEIIDREYQLCLTKNNEIIEHNRKINVSNDNLAIATDLDVNSHANNQNSQIVKDTKGTDGNTLVSNDNSFKNQDNSNLKSQDLSHIPRTYF